MDKSGAQWSASAIATGATLTTVGRVRASNKINAKPRCALPNQPRILRYALLVVDAVQVKGCRARLEKIFGGVSM